MVKSDGTKLNHAAKLAERVRLVGSQWIFPIGILVIALVMTFQDGPTGSLRYERGAIFGGEVYRLITFHFVHLSPAHYLVNATGLVLLWLLYGKSMRLFEWVGATVGCSLAIGLLLLLFRPGSTVRSMWRRKYGNDNCLKSHMNVGASSRREQLAALDLARRAPVLVVGVPRVRAKH